jgi:hypothetical protein
MRKAGHKVSWVNQGDDMKEASANFTVDGETTLVKYTWADAVKAKIQGFEKADSAWQRSGPAMMRAALLRKTSKMLCPEVLTGDVDPEEFAGIDEAAVAPKPTKSKAEQEARKAELQREATVAAAETGKPAPAESAPLASQVAAVTAGKKEEAPFDAAQTAGTVAADKPTAEQAKANEHTAILLEIEATIGEAGLTKAKLEEGLRAKNPAFTTIDDLPLENAKALLANIRGKLAKK